MMVWNLVETGWCEVWLVCETCSFERSREGRGERIWHTIVWGKKVCNGVPVSPLHNELFLDEAEVGMLH
jgi:hypothetical protein